MKIAIITFHKVVNYGGVLQALALQKYLGKKQCDVSIIDYNPKYLRQEYAVWKSPLLCAVNRYKELSKKDISFFVKIKRSIYYYLAIVKMNLSALKNMRKRGFFFYFINTNLRLTERYTEKNIHDFDSEPYDLFVCGSDQIWNKQITGGRFDTSYFFEFLPEGKKRCSYSASSGDSLEAEDKGIKEYLEKFCAVSVREQKDQITLTEMLQRRIYHTIDPTLLLSKSDYVEFEDDRQERESFILVYLLERNEKICDMIRYAQEKYKVDKVIDISPSSFFSCDNLHKITVGPGGFLYYVKNAKCVLTNSFHGTVFSIIYHTQFYTFPHSKRASRMVELLEKLGLENRLYGKDLKSQEETQIDWEKVEQQLDIMRNESNKYLESVIE